MNIGNLTAYLGVDTSGFEAALLRADNQMKKMGKSMQTVGRAMSMYVTAPIMALGAGAVMSFKGFEELMSRIIGLVGVAKEQASEWEKEILKMAPALGKSPKELADALYFITSSGISGKDAMDVLTVSVKAASAGLGQTEVVANLVTSAMNAYGVANLSAAQATDILVGATKAGKAEASQLAEAMGMVLPLASAMGVSFDQVAAGMAGMTLTGASASEAATGLRSILANIQKPSSEAEEALKRMGTSSAILRKTIREDGLLKAMQDITNLTKTYGETAVSDVIPDIRALSAILDLMGKNADGNAKIFSDLKNATGLLDQSFAAAAQTTQFKFNAAISAGKASLIEIGKSVSTAIIPIMEGLVKVIKNVGSWFGNLSDSSKQFIIITAGIVAAIGPVMYVVGGMIAGFSKLVAIIKVVAIALAGLSLPITIVVTALAAVAVGFSLWSEKGNEVLSFQKKMGSEINKELGSLTLLFSGLKNAAAGTKERSSYIQEINTRYGKYLDNLLTEKSSLQDIEKAQRKVTGAMIADISVKMNKEELQNQFTEISEEFDSQFGAFTQKYSQLKGGAGFDSLISDIYSKSDELVKLTGGNIKRGILEYSSGAKEIWDKYFKDISQMTGYTKYSLQDFQSAFIEFSKVKGEKKPMLEYLQNTINSFEKIAGVSSATGDVVVKDLTKEEIAAQKVAEANQIQADKVKATKESYIKFQETLKAINKEYELTKSLTSDTTILKEAEIKNVNDLYNAYRAYYLETGQGIEKLKELYATIQSFHPTVKFAERLIPRMAEAIQLSVDEANKVLEKGVQTKDIYWGADFGIQKWVDANLEAGQRVKEMWVSVKQSVAGSIASLATSIGASLGGMKTDWNDMAMNALKSIQQVIQGLFMEALMILFVDGSIKGGLVMGLAAATVGLAAIVALMSQSADNLQGMYMGGEVLKSGAFQINERGGETAILPKGTKVMAHGASSSGEGGFVARTKVLGSDLLMIIERATAKKKRGF